MDTQKKGNQSLTKNQIIRVIIWVTALIIIASTYTMESSYKDLGYIIMSGIFIEILRISSSNNQNKKKAKI